MQYSSSPSSPFSSHIVRLIIFLVCLLLSISCGDGDKEEVPDREKISEAKKALEEENYLMMLASNLLLVTVMDLLVPMEPENQLLSKFYLVN